MNIRFIKTSLFALALTAGLSACSKDDDDPKPDPGGDGSAGEVTFTIDGDKFSKQTITIKTIPGPNHLSQGSTYTVKGKDTYCVAGSVNETDPQTGLPQNEFTLNFYGDKIGTQAAGYKYPDGFGVVDHTSFELTLARNGESRDYYYNLGNFDTPTPGSVTITKYGGVGERIEGTFQGTLTCLDDVGKGEGEKAVKITNGHFWFRRHSDN